MIWIPTNILPDIVLGEAKNIQLSVQGFKEQPIPYKPKPYNKNGVLWWHVPEFLEENVGNETIENIASKSFWISRRDALTKFYENTIDGYIDKKYQSNLWEKGGSGNYLDSDSRYDLFNKILYLAGSGCYGRMGNHISGLYLDFEKFKGIFELNPRDAERIVDNNIFVGDMAILYSAAVENHDKMGICESLKQKYKTALDMAVLPNVHFKTNNQVQSDLSDQYANIQPGEKLIYKGMMDDHIKEINKFSRSF